MPSLSIIHTHPHLAEQWHQTKNTLAIEKATAGMDRKAWWNCEKRHEWEASIKQRAKGSGCPKCAKTGRYLKPVPNSITETHLQLLDIWHPSKNLPVTPEVVTASSSRKIWWVCKRNHEWERAVHDMIRRSPACPYCTGKKVIKGETDLRTMYPDIASQWHPTRNTFTSDKISPESHYKAWWECSEGHEWEAIVQNRTRKNTRCPYCAGRKVLEGEIAKKYPELMLELDPENFYNRNTLTFSSRPIWMCQLGHKWESLVAVRLQGSGCPICSNNVVLSGFNDLMSTHPNLSQEWDYENNTLVPDQVSYGSRYIAGWKCAEGHIWEAKVNDRTAKKSGCPYCLLSSQRSQAEKEITNYLQKLDILTDLNNRKVLSGKEIDIYLPEHKIGFEYNGLYWHSEAAGKDRIYHHAKWVAAKNAGIQLIQIWEDDYKRNPELIKRMLAHKLGVSQQRKIYARTTQIEEMSTAQTQLFLESNHIQGHANGSYYLGLRDGEKSDIVAVLVLKKEPGTEGRTLNIIRYATSCNVVGGFTKLLKHAERTYLPKSFITFADHCVSDGGLYENNGFVADKELAPDYMYVVKGKRKHKFGYRLKRFRNDPTLKFEEGLTEKELATLNNLPRVWDAGKTRYVKHVD